MIYFTSYDGGKSIRILSLYYFKLMGTIEEHERRKNFIICHYNKEIIKFE